MEFVVGVGAAVVEVTELSPPLVLTIDGAKLTLSCRSNAQLMRRHRQSFPLAIRTGQLRSNQGDDFHLLAQAEA